MKSRLFLYLILLLFLITSCIPSATPTAQPMVVEPSVTPILSKVTEGSVVEGPTQALAPTPLPIATSRGPDLHATDPTTVNFTSGQLQFVEFFRFT